MVASIGQGIRSDLFAAFRREDALNETAAKGTPESVLSQSLEAVEAQQSGDTVTISEEVRKLAERLRDAKFTDSKGTESNAQTVARFEAEKSAELMTEMLPSQGQAATRSDEAETESGRLDPAALGLARGANAKTPVQRHVGQYDAPGASMARIEEALSWFADTDAGPSANTGAAAE